MEHLGSEWNGQTDVKRSCSLWWCFV